MKKWIAQQWIALAEVFGWGTPTWIGKLVSSDELAALTSRERDLSEMLRTQSPNTHPVPAFLKEKIERGIHDASPESKRKFPWPSLLLPATGFAMAVMVGFLVLSPNEPQTPESIPVATLPATPDSPVNASFPAMERIGEGLAGLEKSLIMRPLAMEQERLAADVTHALQFMTRSILPDAYADDLNARLDSLRKESGPAI